MSCMKLTASFTQLCTGLCRQGPRRPKGAEVSPGGQQQQQQHQLAVGSLLDDQHWHRVRVEHFRAHLNMTVDSNTRQTHVPTQLTLWDIQQGNVTFSCAEPLSIATTFAGSQSFLRLPGVMVARPPGVMSVGLQFRTWNAAGLLLTFRLPAGPGAEEEDEEVWLYLRKARLHLESRRNGLTRVNPKRLSQSISVNDCRRL
ncbi:hypothetical protein CRUP_025660 [Coryphaenoides rupestris]|nr:hypothetical protein CRUP_025660 [Coryphaenoides rupestris]